MRTTASYILHLFVLRIKRNNSIHYSSMPKMVFVSLNRDPININYQIINLTLIFKKEKTASIVVLQIVSSLLPIIDHLA